MADPTSDAPLTRYSLGPAPLVYDVDGWADYSLAQDTVVYLAAEVDARLAALQRERDDAKEEVRMGHVRLDECSDMVGTGDLNLYTRIGLKLQKNYEQRQALEARYPELPVDINEWLTGIARDRATVARLEAEKQTLGHDLDDAMAEVRRIAAEQGALRTEKAQLQTDLLRDRDAWQSRYQEESKIVDNVWAALGISTVEEAKGLGIAEHVQALRTQVADLRTCPVCGCRWAHPGQTDCPLCAAQAGMAGISDLQQQVTDLSRLKPALEDIARRLTDHYTAGPAEDLALAAAIMDLRALLARSQGAT